MFHKSFPPQTTGFPQECLHELGLRPDFFHFNSNLREKKVLSTKNSKKRASYSSYVTLCHISILRTQMWPIVTDRVVWSVRRSVAVVSPAKLAEPIDMPFGCRLVRAQGTMY